MDWLRVWGVRSRSQDGGGMADESPSVPSTPESALPVVCSICGNPVLLVSAVTDADGKSVHEECYVASLGQRPLRGA